MSEIQSPVWWLTVALVAAIIGGHLAQKFRIPRIVGYLAGGIALNWLACLGGRPGSVHVQDEQLSLITEISLGLILFTIGGVFESVRLKATWPTLRLMSLCEIALTFLLTSVGCAAACWIQVEIPLSITINAEMTLPLSITMGLLLGTVAIATAPAATYLVLHEFEAKGPTTDHLLGMTGLNNLVSIVAFNAVFMLCAWFGWISDLRIESTAPWVDLFLMSVASAVLGVGLGVLLSVLHARVSAEGMIFAFFAVVLGLWTTEDWMRSAFSVAFNPLVAFLAMGAVFANLALNPQRFEKALATTSAPIFALFFVLAGYNLQLDQLGHLGLLGFTYIAMRLVGKVLGVRAGVHLATGSAMVGRHSGLGLVCQAGVAIGLGTFLVDAWDNTWAETIHTVILASVALNELVGPILVKYTAVRAGEVKVISLLRPRGGGSEAAIWQVVRRTICPGPRGRGAVGPLTVRHVMRTNVQFLPAAAEFSEVLHFIERSRFNDFPVADSDSRYVGLVSLSTIQDLMFDPAMAQLVTAGDLADQGIPAVIAEMPLPELLEVFHKHNRGAIAVVDQAETNRLTGIVEQRDVLRALHREQTDEKDLRAAGSASRPERR